MSPDELLHAMEMVGKVGPAKVGTTDYPLTCTESDVAHAVFSWPTGLAPEAGTTAEFVMKSRGGVEDGQVYTSKKTVTIIAGDPVPLKRIALTDFDQTPVTTPSRKGVQGRGRPCYEIGRTDRRVRSPSKGGDALATWPGRLRPCFDRIGLLSFHV